MLTLSYTGEEGARTNFKDSYLGKEYHYCNDVWYLFIKFDEEDSVVLIKPVPIKPLPWQPLFQKPF